MVRGRDTIDFRDATFTPSAESLAVSGETPLRLSAEKDGVRLDLTYTFEPDDYRVRVSGRVSDVGPNGGALLVGMGPTLANTEVNIEENHRELALVTKRDDTERTDLGEPGAGRAPGAQRALPVGRAQVQVLRDRGDRRRLHAAAGSAAPPSPRLPAPSDPTSADIRLSMPLQPSGAFGYTVYAGPMEYDRLARVGHDFDDVNPYGWPGFRTIIRVFAVPVRWLLVWMHENLHLAYGLVLVVFGILVRIVLWPLNQKAMRANMKLQEVQPLMKEIQERYKSDPQRMQQEVFKLYKEYKVNPLGGCWPMLLPMPVLFALFFVFQNAIELRGTSFMWIPDLSRPDPLYVIPILMGASMYCPDQGRPDGDGAESADEDDALHDAPHDDGHVPLLPVRAQPVLHGEQHREHPAAVDARPGADEADRAGDRGREDRAAPAPPAGAGQRSGRRPRGRSVRGMLSDPIAALATPPGRSALAVVRLSGRGAFEVAARVVEGFRSRPPADGHARDLSRRTARRSIAGSTPSSPRPTATPERTWSSSPATEASWPPRGSSPRSTPRARGQPRPGSSPAARCSTASSIWCRPRRWET